uniref:Helicase ATP-binding domain-containing protein n=1 Tax=Caenorhabditis tropicalis TaxID=1561998 RepID=A0A1I7UG47_9PELO
MPPKKPQKPGLMQFFAKRQQEKYQTTQTAQEPSVDDSCQVLFEKPVSTPTKSPILSSRSKVATKWSETLQKSSDKAGRDWMNPFSISVVSSAKKANLSNSKTDLLENGFDGIRGNGLFYPIDEPIRSFEENLLKCATTSNCCIAIPSSAPSTSGKICAMTVFNFLKWFPRCRVFLVGSSEDWITSLRRIGLESMVTKLTTVTQFKNLKKDSGQILFCTSPQCALKVVESEEAKEFLEEIRLVIMDLKPTECCTKYKPIINALTVRDIFFRCIVLTTATSNASRRTASITKRQLMITNLHLSDWIEQTETDFSFRASNIPAGVEVKTWNSNENSSKLQETISNFEKFCQKIIDDLARQSIMPSKSIKKSIWTCWKSVKQANPTEIEKVEMAEFLTTSYKLLIIDGVVAARNYAKQYSEHIKIGDLTKKLMENSILGGFSEFPAKFRHLSESIEAFLRMNNHILGVILCRDSDQAIEIQNYLQLQLNTRCTFIRIIEEGAPMARNLWNLQRISTVFLDRKSPKIVILPVKIRDFIGYADGLPLTELTFITSVSRECLFNFRRFAGAYLLISNDPLELLRKEDGRLIVDDGKYGQKEAKNVMKVGAVERYDFKFEPSRLRINVAHLPVQFFFPRQVGGVSNEIEQISYMGKTHIEMSSKEHAELYQRLQNPDFSRFQRRKRPFWILRDFENPNEKKPIEVEEMDDVQVCWNQDIQYLGDIKHSKLSERMTKYMKDGPVEWGINDRKRFEYINEIDCKPQGFYWKGIKQLPICWQHHVDDDGT